MNKEIFIKLLKHNKLFETVDEIKWVSGTQYFYIHPECISFTNEHGNIIIRYDDPRFLPLIKLMMPDFITELPKRAFYNVYRIVYNDFLGATTNNHMIHDLYKKEKIFIKKIYLDEFKADCLGYMNESLKIMIFGDDRGDEAYLLIDGLIPSGKNNLSFYFKPYKDACIDKYICIYGEE